MKTLISALTMLAALAATPALAQSQGEAPVVIKGVKRLRPAPDAPLPALDMFVKPARIERIALSDDGSQVAFTTHVDGSHLLALFDVATGNKRAIKLKDEPLSAIRFVDNGHLMIAHTYTGLRSTCANGTNQQARNGFASMVQRQGPNLKPGAGFGDAAGAVETALAASMLGRLRSPACVNYGVTATNAIIVVDLKTETANQIGFGMDEYHHAALNLPVTLHAGGKPELVGSFLELRGTSMNLQPTQRAYLWRVDAVTGAGKMVDDGGGDLDREYRFPDDWLIAPDGSIMARTVYEYDSQTFSIQVPDGPKDKKGRTKWKSILSRKVARNLDSFAPQMVGLGRDGRAVLIVDRDSGGVYRYHELSADGKVSEALNPGDATTDRPIFHPKTRHLAGFMSQGEVPAYTFFDSNIAKIYAAATDAAPGQAVKVVAMAEDPRRMILSTHGDVEAGNYYYLNLVDGSYIDLGNDHAAVPAEWIARQSVVSYKSRDGLDIKAILTLPSKAQEENLPVVILPHDGPLDHDAMGFDWLAQSIASRGFAVLQPNYRGSDNAGPAFAAAGDGQWGARMLDDMADGIKYLAAEGIGDAKRACIVGTGYGGYAALAGAVASDGVYRCAVSVGGISDPAAYKSWVANHRPLPDPDAFGGLEPDADFPRTFKTADSYKRLQRQLGTGELAAPAARAEQAVPTLLLHPGQDRKVPDHQSRMMRDAAKGRISYIEMTGCDHELTTEACRLQAAQAVTDFLVKYNP